jgi:hypothetical protein
MRCIECRKLAMEFYLFTPVVNGVEIPFHTVVCMEHQIPTPAQGDGDVAWMVTFPNGAGYRLSDKRIFEAFPHLFEQWESARTIIARIPANG